MRRALILFLTVFLWSCSETTGPRAERELALAVATITADDLRDRIGMLASDAMGGRETPSPGLEGAADYIAGELAAFGLEAAGDPGSYLQRWPMLVSDLDVDGVTLGIDGAGPIAMDHGTDYFLAGGVDPVVSELLVWGGSTADPVIGPGVSMAGRVLVVDHPVAAYGDPWWAGVTRARDTARERGALAVVLVLHEAFPAGALEYLAWITEPILRQPVYMGITPAVADALLADAGTSLAALRAGGPTVVDATVRLEAPRNEGMFTPPNVVARLPGSDPVLAGETILVLAHYDHLGIGPADATGDSIYNGADDNASGTAALLEIAEAFQALPEAPARSLVFLAVSGEEKGLLGSRHYAANPTVQDIVGVVNLDMVSRDPFEGVLVAVGIRYTTIGDEAARVAEDRPELNLEVVPEAEGSTSFFRSDHFSFVEQRTPAIFFTTGGHEDYHRPSDEVTAIDADKAERVARLVFYVTRSLAVAGDRPAWTAAGEAMLAAVLR